MFIATLIAAENLSGGDISAARDRLDQAGCLPAAHVWIDRGFAADIDFGLNPEAARTALDGAFPGVDIVVQPAESRAKRLLVAEMDSTMITVECIDELAVYAGIAPQIAAVT